MYNAGSLMHLRLTCDEIRSTSEVLVATSWSRATFGKMTVAHVVKKFRVQMDPETPVPYSQEPATLLCLQPVGCEAAEVQSTTSHPKLNAAFLPHMSSCRKWRHFSTEIFLRISPLRHLFEILLPFLFSMILTTLPT